jgi:hypothetical protein
LSSGTSAIRYRSRFVDPLHRDLIPSPWSLVINGKMVEASTSGVVEVRSTELFHLAGAHDTFKGKDGISGDIFFGTGNDVAVAGKGKVAIDVGEGNTTP